MGKGGRAKMERGKKLSTQMTMTVSEVKKVKQSLRWKSCGESMENNKAKQKKTTHPIFKNFPRHLFSLTQNEMLQFPQKHNICFQSKYGVKHFAKSVCHSRFV